MIFKHTFFLFVALYIAITPFHVSRAAQLSFEVTSSEVENDTATIIEVFLEPEGAPINAIEGVVRLFGDGTEHLSPVVVETGGSALSYWLVYPEYSVPEGVIRFTGGTPESFSEKKSLFRMRVYAETQGELTVSWLGGFAYRDDGEGTEEVISARSLSMMVTKSEPNQMSASSVDVNPPYFDEIKISQDTDVYDGKYFLSFHAVDDISGIAGYDVVEGGKTTRADNGIYLLEDQEREAKIVIIAYDGAGNSVSVRAPTKYDWISKILFSGASVLLVMMLWYWYTRHHRKSLFGLGK